MPKSGKHSLSCHAFEFKRTSYQAAICKYNGRGKNGDKTVAGVPRNISFYNLLSDLFRPQREQVISNKL